MKEDNAGVDRYLAIVSRARRLFARNGLVPVSKGGKPLAYSRIESAAWDKYCKNNPVIS